MKYRLQVLGIGSPSGDDRVGWQVIEGLAVLLEGEASLQQWRHQHRLHLEALDRPGPALIERLAQAEETWLVDALAGPPPGILLHPSSAALACNEAGSSHSFGVCDALHLADALGRLPERLELFAISIAQAHPLSDQLSAPVQQAAEQLCLQLRQRICAHFD